MELTYIYHSGFCIESEDTLLIIDYYKGGKNAKKNTLDSTITEKIRTYKGNIYVLCSHSHADHFNPHILEWSETRADIQFIFSSDIDNSSISSHVTISYLDKLDTYKDDILEVKAFGSTDIGISFLLKLADKTLFHAGDLNNWHWNEEASPQEILLAESQYEQELNLLAGEVQHLHLAMFPIDPRLGKEYMKGAKQFVAKIKTDIFAPMHFDGAFEQAAAFSPFAKKAGCKCICWQHENETIVF